MTAAPAVPARGAAIQRLTARGLTGKRTANALCALKMIRPSDWVLLAFLFYAQVLACLRPAIQAKVALWNSAILLAYALLLYRDSVKPTFATRVARDWFPLALVLFAYREMGWFAQPHVGAVLESRWIVWDRLLLRGGGKAAVEVFGPVLPSILEVAYSLVYTLAPFSIAVLYLTGRRDRIDRFLFVFVLGVLLCYAQFPFWPSEPPRVVFFGQDSPSYDTIFRRFNLWMLGNYGIHTSVFPSAHVAGAFAAAFGMRQAAPSAKGVTRFLFVIAILIAAATFYGRYHYATDVAAGFLIAASVSALARAVGSAQAVRAVVRDGESEARRTIPASEAGATLPRLASARHPRQPLASVKVFEN
jgi:membrane-associated phospholipid phosphatase